MQSLQSMFRHALEESRGAQRELAASRARNAQLEAQLGQLSLHLWHYQQQQQQAKGLCCGQPAPPSYMQATVHASLPVPTQPGSPAAGPPLLAAHGGLVGQCLADQLTAVRQGGLRQGDGSSEGSGSEAGWSSRHQPATAEAGRKAAAGHTSTRPAAIPQAEAVPAALDAAGSGGRPQGVPVPSRDLQRVYGEIAALQATLQAAEQCLMAAGCPDSMAHAPPAAACGGMAQQGQAAFGAAPEAGVAGACPGEVAPAGLPAWTAPRRPGSPGAAGRQPPSPAGKQQRESWELVHSLRQRKARLEALHAAAAGITLAQAAPPGSPPRAPLLP